jgi:hypothetical protein
LILALQVSVQVACCSPQNLVKGRSFK